MKNLFTTNSDNFYKLSDDELKEKFYNLLKNIPEKIERNGFIMIPDINGFKVYEIEEKTLSKLLQMVEFVRRNPNLFEPLKPIEMELNLNTIFESDCL
jgi:hypothetical protein